MNKLIKKSCILLATCAMLASCGSSSGKSSGQEDYPSIAWSDEDIAAVAFLGTYQKEDALRSSRLFDRFSQSYGLADIPSVKTSGDEWYLVIPRHTDAEIKVSSAEIGEDGSLKVSSQLCDRDGKPFLLKCNVSDLHGNTIIHITDKDGRTLDYTPSLSLENGSLALADNVLNITGKLKPVKPQPKAHYSLHEFMVQEAGFPEINAFIHDGKAFVSLSQSVDECPAGEYEIEGLSGKCHGLFISDIGQDINPVVCLAMENGGLEILSVFNSTRNGDFRSSGLLDGFKDIEAFKDSTVTDMYDGEIAGAYVTIFAFDKNGKGKEIELNTTATTEISFLSTVEGERITEHKLFLSPDWKIRYSTGWLGGDPIEECLGRIRPLKIDYDNNIFEYSYEISERLVYGQDDVANVEKTNMKGSFRMYEDNNGFVVTRLSGPLTFGFNDEDGVF